MSIPTVNRKAISIATQQVLNKASYHTPQIIGLTGCQYAGKSTVAETLSFWYGYKRVSFAEPIKRMLLIIGVPYESLYGTKAEKERIVPKFGKSGRYMMQMLGTEWGRDLISINIWVSLAKEEIEKHVDAGKYVVIDDCRFASELAMINKMYGCVYRVISNEGLEGRTKSNHISDTELDKYDFLPDFYNTEDRYSLSDKIHKTGRWNMHESAYSAYLDNCNKLLTEEPK